MPFHRFDKGPPAVTGDRPRKIWGRTAFSAEGQRRFFFVLTVLMLIAGLLARAGLF